MVVAELTGSAVGATTLVGDAEISRSSVGVDPCVMEDGSREGIPEMTIDGSVDPRDGLGDGDETGSFVGCEMTDGASDESSEREEGVSVSDNGDIDGDVIVGYTGLVDGSLFDGPIVFGRTSLPMLEGDILGLGSCGENVESLGEFVLGMTVNTVGVLVYDDGTLDGSEDIVC